MILKSKENIDPVLVKNLKDYIYDIIGSMQEVSKELPCGLPEYIYQEAFDNILSNKNIVHHKEFIHHPVFKGKELNSFLKMDFMIEREHGNIIVECKAIEKIGPHERQQLLSYLIGTGFPIGILVNFAHYPNPYIEKYFFDKSDMTINAF